MTYTIHGHHIPGTPDEGFTLANKARCGGSKLCSVCRREAASYYQSLKGSGNLESELQALINKYLDAGNLSGSRDYLLAQFMNGSLKTFNEFVDLLSHASQPSLFDEDPDLNWKTPLQPWSSKEN